MTLTSAITKEQTTLWTALCQYMQCTIVFEKACAYIYCNSFNLAFIILLILKYCFSHIYRAEL